MQTERKTRWEQKFKAISVGVDVIHKKTTNNTSAELKEWKMY